MSMQVLLVMGAMLNYPSTGSRNSRSPRLGLRLVAFYNDDEAAVADLLWGVPIARGCSRHKPRQAGGFEGKASAKSQITSPNQSSQLLGMLQTKDHA